MFSHLATLPRPLGPFDVWPVVTGTPEGDRGYWYRLPARLLEMAGDLQVWPVLPGKYAALSDVLIVSGMDEALVAALRSCTVPILTPPPTIFELVKASSKYISRLATPSLVRPYLQVRIPVTYV